MSQLADGSFVCSRCGTDVGNGGLEYALLLHDLHPFVPGGVTTYRFCRDKRDEKGRIVKKGCEGSVRTRVNLDYYLKVIKEPERARIGESEPAEPAEPDTESA